MDTRLREAHDRTLGLRATTSGLGVRDPQATALSSGLAQSDVGPVWECAQIKHGVSPRVDAQVDGEDPDDVQRKARPNLWAGRAFDIKAEVGTIEVLSFDP